MDTTKECWSKDNEEFSSEDLGDLLETWGDELRPGHAVYRGTAKAPDISSLVDADFVIEEISKRAWDFGGEHAEGYPDVTPEHKAKLQAFLEQWLNECPAPRFWQVIDVQPYVLTADDFTEEQPQEIAAAEEDERRTAQAAAKEGAT